MIIGFIQDISKMGSLMGMEPLNGPMESSLRDFIKITRSMDWEHIIIPMGLWVILSMSSIKKSIVANMSYLKMEKLFLLIIKN